MSVQQENCIFCKIARGEIPCTSVFESDELIAFLDISPVNKGHTLVVPKAHMETLFDMPDELGNSLIAAMKRIGTAIMRATGAEGLNVIQNNYPAAGQQVPHLHWHLIPRFSGDGYAAWPQSAYGDMREMASLAAAIREKIVVPAGNDTPNLRNFLEL